MWFIVNVTSSLTKIVWYTNVPSSSLIKIYKRRLYFHERMLTFHDDYDSFGTW